MNSLDVPWRRRADLSASEEPVLEGPGAQFPATISPDGEWLYFVTTLGGVNLHLSRLPLREDSEPQVLVAEDALNWYPSISPDGRYMAFEKWSGTERNVFVLDLETRARWPVSAGEGP